MKKLFNPIKDKSAEIIEFLMSSPDMPKEDSSLFKIRLSVEETVENIVRYAYEDCVGWMEAGTELDSTGLHLSITLKDAGKPFNPLDKPDPDINADLDDRPIGGLGIFLCKQLMDDVTYRYEDGCNILTLVKSLTQQ